MARAELLALSKSELAEKERLERIVDEGKVSFVAVGHALREIKDHPEWYLPQSFESYCQERFGFKRAHVTRLRAASAVSEVLWGTAPVGAIPEERTVRPLTKLLKCGDETTWDEQSDRIEAAWARACKLAEEEGVTVAGRHAKAAVDELLGIRKAEPPRSGSGLEIAREAASKLNEIHVDDPERAEAFAFLRRWLDAHEA